MHQSSQDVEQQLKNIGERLAVLLGSADMPDDVKDAWVALIPKMSLEQIDRLVGILEKQLSGAAQSELKAFVDMVEQAKKDHAQKAKDTQEKAIKEMEEIEKMIGD